MLFNINPNRLYETVEKGCVCVRGDEGNVGVCAGECMGGELVHVHVGWEAEDRPCLASC